MAIYKPSELREFLNALGISPKKALSQNFLIDGNIINKIIRCSEVEADDIVVEIGPGPGSLTEALLKSGASVIAVERDTILATALERLKEPTNQLQIFCEDIMDFPLEEKVKEALQPGKKAKVIANLPYHLTTPIIEKLITMNDLFSTLTLMVQEEVAYRFIGNPGTKEYSSFTVFLQFYSKPVFGFSVSSHCFFPSPKVNSAVVVLELKEPEKVSNVSAFFKFTRTAFGQRRKMLRGSLKEIYPPQRTMQALEIIGMKPEARPEELSLQQFIRLFELLQTMK